MKKLFRLATLFFLLSLFFSFSSAQAAEELSLQPTLAIIPPPSNAAQAEVYEGSFLYTSASEMLDKLGVKVNPEDYITAFPNPKLGLGSTVKVYRAQEITILDAGKRTELRSWAKTVGELLDEQRIEVAQQDIVQPAVETAITVSDSPLRVSITRVEEADVKVTKPVDFTTQTKDDPDSPRGTKKVAQAGKAGVRTLTYHVRRENGKEVSRTLSKNEITKEPVTEIILKGTKVVSYGTGKASWYDYKTMSAAHLTLPFGTKVRVTNLGNGKSVVVTIADRGPYVAGRIIDLSADAFKEIGTLGTGVINVKVEAE